MAYNNSPIKYHLSDEEIVLHSSLLISIAHEPLKTANNLDAMAKFTILNVTIFQKDNFS